VFVAQGLAHRRVGLRGVALDHLQAEGLLGCEMVRERSLRHAGGLHDVAHAGATKPPFVDDLHADLQQFLAVGRLGH